MDCGDHWLLELPVTLGTDCKGLRVDGKVLGYLPFVHVVCLCPITL